MSETKFPWTNLEEASIKRYIFLLYGDAGSGKTVLAARFPEPLILSCDPGSLGGCMSAVKFKPKFLRIESYIQFLNLIPALREQAGKEFKTVVMDSMSYFQRLVMKPIIEAVGREKPRFDEWSLCIERMRSTINVVADINANIVFTATTNLSKDEVTGQIFGGPDLPGKLQKELPQACDVVLRLFAQSGYSTTGQRTVRYKYISVPDGVFPARDRTRVFPTEGDISEDNVEGFAPFKRLLFS